jgi:hypothetical protein
MLSKLIVESHIGSAISKGFGEATGRAFLMAPIGFMRGSFGADGQVVMG